LNPTSTISREKIVSQSYIRCNNGNLNIQIASAGNHVFLKLYDLKGTLLRTIPLKTTASGSFSSSHTLSDLPNGNYFVEICSGKQTLETSKIILTK
jgi:flagellar hook assembly protein FlgD